MNKRVVKVIECKERMHEKYRNDGAIGEQKNGMIQEI